MATHNTWDDPRIFGHTVVNPWLGDAVVREAAEHLHRNESIHRHDPSGVVCVYCAISAVRAVRIARAHLRGAGVTT